MKPLLPVLVGCALAAAGSAAAAQPLGRLFFTPEQRDALDARRRAKLPDKPAAVLQPPVTRIDGQVTRSGRNSTVWVNGEPYAEGEDAGGVRVYPGRADPSRVGVTVGETGKRVGLKVGETLDRGSGEVRDVIGEGELKVHRGGGAAR
jgi:hypothetical protein